MLEDQIKEAFSRVKEDIFAIKEAINILSDEIGEIKRTLDQTHNQTRQTDKQITQTVPQEIGGSENQNSGISTGNEGVQTDRQTNRQTDTTEENKLNFQVQEATKSHIYKKFALTQTPTYGEKDTLSKVDKVSEVLNTLDTIKKELRSQFKKLTDQEMFIFSILYQLEDQNLSPDYKLISNKANLSESSIRDYIQKIIKKGIPIDKIKENNKKITLSIPQNLRRMATLDTILTLREL